MMHTIGVRHLHRREGTENPLIRVVEPFDQRARHALYAAANRGSLRRRTWNGCALDRAAVVLGASVKSKRDAVRVFDVRRRRVSEFLRVWDRLPGSDATCAALLRDAVLAVGLFDEPSHVEPSHVDGAADVDRRGTRTVTAGARQPQGGDEADQPESRQHEHRGRVRTVG
jgi:hypothetical protein